MALKPIDRHEHSDTYSSGILDALYVFCSIGKRSCIGEILARQSIFLFLTSLVQRFDIRPPEGLDSISVAEVIALVTVPSHFEVHLIPRVEQLGVNVEMRDEC